jgi:hypothetical protein
VVSSGDKKGNYKEDTLYLWWDWMMKAALVWEMLLGCKHNHAEHGEGCDAAGNDTEAAQEG